MLDAVPQILLRYRRYVGLAAILISALTWAVDMSGFVYECPYCRSQRTVIGLLGVLLMLPNPARWWVRYLSAVFAVFGSSVAASQHFTGWARIMGGKFEWGERWYINSWMLSGFALFIIVGLLLLIWLWRSDISAGADASAAAGGPAG